MDYSVDKLITIVNKVLNESTKSNYVLSYENIDDDLSLFKVDSLDFIKIIVNIEENFNLEIPYNKLIFSELNSIRKIDNAISSIKNLN